MIARSLRLDDQQDNGITPMVETARSDSQRNGLASMAMEAVMGERVKVAL
ncbi:MULTISPECIES: hypothetical protein [unclassified Oceanobacter]|nr:MULTISPECIES: hypothetical protein [unclassified Oceanobacter]MDO6680683.1 hypothetical protein [Oceanobacter sp. 5_MG-2023]MDP2547696.1 hypothetical protein [Oceanobacter sp. 4_MG-2023]MDP2610403.1 hypothetical protein [Oceanobacter sp. 1_MG-2023]MDP2613639.1 hypothetical protein [Oceanobacter sp. 2_MG-2023]